MKKLTTLLIMLVIIALVAAGCGGGNSGNSGDAGSSGSGGDTPKGNKQELLFWTPFSGADGEFMKKMVEKYNSSQDAYKINFVIQPNGEYYKMLDVALSSNKDRPDFMIMHVDQHSAFQPRLQTGDGHDAQRLQGAAATKVNPALFLICVPRRAFCAGTPWVSSR